MKKSIVSVPSPAPATQTAPKSTPKSTAAAPKTAAEPAKTFGELPATSAPVLRVKSAPRIKAAVPLVRAEPAPSAAIVIHAKIDVGFGNVLYLRGEGPGLSWDKGVSLDCVSADHWKIALQATRPVVFKFLINDETWSTGDDFVAEPGSDEDYTPSF